MKSNDARGSLVMGGLTATVGLGAGVLINMHPEGLAVPMWIAQLACLSFVFAGAALAINREDYPILHQFMVLALLAVFTAIPVWIAVGPGERACTSNVPFLGGQGSCRVVFGFSALIMLPIMEIARRQLWRMFAARRKAQDDITRENSDHNRVE